MTVESSELNKEFADEQTKKTEGCFDDEEITATITNRPLTLYEFKCWKADEELDFGCPMWFKFYLNFFNNWAYINFSKPLWFTKVKETAPKIFSDITKEIDDFYKIRKNFGATKKQGEIASNAHTISEMLLLITVEPLLFEAYKIARLYTETDEILFR